MTIDKLLTPQEAADHLRLTRKHLLMLCADGTIPSVKMGDQKNSPVRIPAGALAQYLQGLMRGAK